jgi:hypothetical protein
MKISVSGGIENGVMAMAAAERNMAASLKSSWQCRKISANDVSESGGETPKPGGDIGG